MLCASALQKDKNLCSVHTFMIISFCDLVQKSLLWFLCRVRLILSKFLDSQNHKNDTVYAAEMSHCAVVSQSVIVSLQLILIGIALLTTAASSSVSGTPTSLLTPLLKCACV